MSWEQDPFHWNGTWRPLIWSLFTWFNISFKRTKPAYTKEYIIARINKLPWCRLRTVATVSEVVTFEIGALGRAEHLPSARGTFTRDTCDFQCFSCRCWILVSVALIRHVLVLSRELDRNSNCRKFSPLDWPVKRHTWNDSRSDWGKQVKIDSSLIL